MMNKLQYLIELHSFIFYKNTIQYKSLYIICPLCWIIFTFSFSENKSKFKISNEINHLQITTCKIFSLSIARSNSEEKNVYSKDRGCSCDQILTEVHPNNKRIVWNTKCSVICILRGTKLNWTNLRYLFEQPLSSKQKNCWFFFLKWDTLR